MVLDADVLVGERVLDFIFRSIFMKKLIHVCLFIFIGCVSVYSQEPQELVKPVYYLNENRRPFNWYAPYPYEYYYQRRDGRDSCSWQYTNNGLIYTCP